MSIELFRQLAARDLREDAFEFMSHLRGGVYPKPLIEAVERFVTLPCAETALNLTCEFPNIIPVLLTPQSNFNKMLPKEHRGPALEGYDEWMFSFDRNLALADSIWRFLRKSFLEGSLRVGFHRMRDQNILFSRLARRGMRRWFFQSGRTFLRRKITCDRSAFRLVVDLVCIHGVDDRGERFWNGLGAELTPQWHLASEVLYDLGLEIPRFVEVLDVSQPRKQEG